MKNSLTKFSRSALLIVAVIMAILPSPGLQAQLAAPTNVTATPSTINLGQSTNLNATSAGNQIRWYTQQSSGTSLGTSNSGENFSQSPTTNTAYWAEAYKAASNVDLIHDNASASQGLTGFNCRMTTGATAVTVTGYVFEDDNFSSNTTVKVYKMNSAMEYNDMFDGTKWTHLGDVAVDTDDDFIEFPSSITIPANSTYSLYLYSTDSFFGSDKLTCVFGGYPSCTMSDSKLTLTWIGGSSCYNVPFETCFGSTAYSNTVGLPYGGLRYTLPEQTSSSRTSVSVTVNQCANPSSAGTISSAQTICYNTAPSQINGTLPTGHAGTLEYQWQSSANNSNWSDIGSATGQNYTPDALTSTTYFRRRVKVTCLTEWLNSSSVLITVRPEYTTGAILTNGQTINYNGDPGEIGNQTLASGGDGIITYKWQSSTTSQSAGFGDIASTNLSAYNPPPNLTSTTWYRRMAKDGTCSNTFTTSEGVWKVTVLTPSVGTVSVTTVTKTSAASGGEDIDDLDATITAKGIVWNTSTAPTTALSTKTSETIVTGSEDADFTSSLTNLTTNTKYYTRAYIVNSYGTFYGDEHEFYTLADVPSVTVVSDPQTTSLKVAVSNDNNPAATEYAIRLTWNPSKWVQSAGTLGDNEAWQTKAAWGTKTVTGLSVNTEYTIDVKARNGDNAETSFGTATAVYTLANTPDAPSVGSPTASTLDVTISPNGNPSHTRFAIQEAGGKYVQGDGKLDDDVVWKTKAEWNLIGTSTSTVTVSGLSPNTVYTFKVKAKNGDDVETAFSTTTAGRTLANVPGKPTIDGVTASSLDVTLDANSNPAETEFAIRVQYLDASNNNVIKFVKSNDGSLQNSEDWQTNATWGTKTVTPLEVGKEYTFDVKARNNATPKVETTYGEAETAVTCKNPESGGEIVGAATICYNTTPDPIGTVSPALDYGGTLEYRWEYVTVSPTASSTWTVISGTNTDTFSPDALTTSTWYRRAARVDCKTDWVGAALSNVVKITVEEQLTLSCPNDFDVTTDEGVCTASVTFSATVGGTPTPTLTYTVDNSEITSPYDFEKGTTTVLVTAKNYCGTITCSFTVTVTDDEYPTIVGLPSDISQSNVAGSCDATVTWTGPTSADNCDGHSIEQTEGDPSGSIFAVGIHTITYEATDAAGNKVSESFTITLTDNEKPVVVTQDISIQLDVSGNATIVPADIDNGSTDNCSIASYTLDTDQFTPADKGDNEVNLTVTDIHGNSDSETANVFVQNIPKPWKDCDTHAAANGTEDYNFPPANPAFIITATGQSTSTRDVHHVVYQDVCDNQFTIIARLATMKNLGWGGVMVRNDCSSNAAAILVKTQLSNRVIVGYRSKAGIAMINSSAIATIKWMKIQRNGTNFRVFTSNNGTTWQQRYNNTLSNLDGCVQAGIFLESIYTNRTAVATFDNVELVTYLKSGEESTSFGQIESEQQSQQVDLYPNPAEDYTIISIPGNESKVSYQLTDMDGRLIEQSHFTGSEAVLDLSNLKPGTYVLRLDVKGEIVTRRIVVM